MGLIRWLTHNVANTDGTTHSDLAPLELPLASEIALAGIRKTIGSMRRWRIESEGQGEAENTIHATRQTGMMKYVDDIHLRVEPTPSGVRIHARSESRVGKGDLGQNRRNILELFRTLRKQLGHS